MSPLINWGGVRFAVFNRSAARWGCQDILRATGGSSQDKNTPPVWRHAHLSVFIFTQILISECQRDALSAAHSAEDEKRTGNSFTLKALIKLISDVRTEINLAASSELDPYRKHDSSHTSRWLSLHAEAQELVLWASGPRSAPQSASLSTLELNLVIFLSISPRPDIVSVKRFQSSPEAEISCLHIMPFRLVSSHCMHFITDDWWMEGLWT